MSAPQRKRVALVIGAGSVKCAAALGLWKVLKREGIALDLVVGCSGGSLYAASMALGYDADEVEAMTLAMWNRDVTKRRDYASMLGAFLPKLFRFRGHFGMVHGEKVLAALPRADGPAVDELRRRVLRLGWWAIGLGALGWFPGGLAFPLAIDLADGPVPASTYAHFLVSFTLSGLIGVVFSYLGVQYVVLGALLPRVGNPDTFSPVAARAEVRPLTAPFGPFVLLASAIPLTGAVLLIALADGALTLGFRLLAAGLIGLGAFGVALAERAVKRLNRLAAVWVGTGTHNEEDGPASAPSDPRQPGLHPSSSLSS